MKTTIYPCLPLHLRSALLATALLGFCAIAPAAPYTWTPTAAGTYSWDNATSQWTSGFPNLADDVANLNINLAGAQTINLNQAITVGTINLGDSTTGFFTTTIAPNGGSLVMDVASGSANIVRTGGTAVLDEISANIQLKKNLIVSDASGTWTQPPAVTLTSGLKLSGIISESGGVQSITKNGSGVLSINGVNTFSGGVTLGAGTLYLGNNKALGTGTLTINGGVLGGIAALSITNNNPIVANGNFTINPRTTDWNTGTGTFQISKALTITLSAQAGGGSLTIPSAITDTSGGNNFNAFDIAWTIGNSSTSLTLSSPITLRGNQTATISINAASTSVTYSGAIGDGGNNYGLTLAGASTGSRSVNFNAANTYTGATKAGTGTCLWFGNVKALQYSALNASSAVGSFKLNSTNGGAYTFGGITDGTGTVQSLANLFTGTNNVNYPFMNELVLNPQGSASNSYTGIIADPTARNLKLTKTGTGTQILGGASTYTGATSIGAGTLSISTIKDWAATGAVASAVGAPATAPNGTIGIGSTTTAGTLVYIGAAQNTNRVINLAGTTGGAVVDQSGSGLLKFTSACTATGAGSKTLTLQGSTAGTGEIAGSIVDNSLTNITSLTKTGTGTWSLSAANTYTGTTTLNNGVLNLGVAENTNVSGPLGKQLANAANTIALGGGTLQYSASNNADYSGRFSTAASQLYKVDTNGVDVTWASALTSTGGSLTKFGVGTLTLQGVNTYTGNTTVSGGTLALATNAGLMFAITDATSNKVTGSGAATFDGVFTIDTSALTATSGTWTLVDTVTASFTTNFTLAGAGWSRASGVWTKVAGAKTWSFSETTGVLSLSTSTTFTVSFESYGGSVVASQFVAPGDMAHLPAAPTQSNYSFVGWCSDSELTTAFDFGTVITSDILLYAKWVADWVVMFESNGGSAVAVQYVVPNATVTQPAVPTRIGYTFAGWYSDSGFISTFSFSSAITADATLYAKWLANYTVAFNTNGASPVSSQIVASGNTATQPATPTRTGYTFAGWYSDSGFTSGFSFSTAITADMTIYVKWLTDFTVAFSTNGGTAVSSQIVPDGSTATQPAAPTRTGYTFVQWCSDSPPTTLFNFTTPITADTTLYAKWVADWVVTFDSNGGSAVASKFVPPGNTFTQPATPTWTGHTFIGWCSDSPPTTLFNFSTVITADTTLYAKWVTDWVVTFDSNGGSAVTFQYVTPDNTAAQPASPTRTGYTFVQWCSDSPPTTLFNFSTAITADTTLYAKWTINSYTLTYSAAANGSLVGSTPQTVDYLGSGTAVSAQAATGYQFYKWSDGKTLNPRTDTNVAANITVTASFEVIPPPVTPDSTFKRADGKTVATFSTAGRGTWTIPAEATEVEVLAVGGGGGSWNDNFQSGSGAGGMYYSSSYAMTAGSPITIMVGAGASQGTGGDSQVGPLLIAYGGTKGNGYTDGGDQGAHTLDGGATLVPGNLGYHYSPMDGNWSSGGGAGHTGYKGDTQMGGAGAACAITGSSVYYAGGGGAPSSYSASGASGHNLGGGGTGPTVTGSRSFSGLANTGGGGGGGWGGGGGAGGSGVVIVAYLASTPYQTWAAGTFTNAFSDTDPTHDPDADGMTNFQEFAFGLDPSTGASANPITVPLDKSTHTFSYTRYAASGLTYTVWTSTDLQTWSMVLPANMSENVGTPDSKGVVTVGVTLTSPPAGDKLFVRVQAE